MNSLDMFTDEQLINLMVKEPEMWNQLYMIVTLQLYFNSTNQIKNN